MILGRNEIEALIPHAGSMCLIDRVLAWDAHTIRCQADSHRSADHPLRHAGRLSSLALIEYGAQAMAIHGGLLAQRRAPAPPAYLAALHEAAFSVAFIDALDAPLTVDARATVRLDNGVVYAFTVACEALGTLLQARATVINLPQATPGGTA